MAYIASLSQSQSRGGWCVIFRHPSRRDETTGKLGKRIRRGLGTTDKKDAQGVIDQLNVLLADESYWAPAARPGAEARFGARVAEIFYDGLTPEMPKHATYRDSFIPLPSSKDTDYRHVLLIGTTGAGKTTLVRQLIGVDGERERFPSTSAAKTTIADTEVILQGEEYRAVVTFASPDDVRAHLEECVSSAALAAFRKLGDGEVAHRLLNHVNQRYRFSYVLGRGPWAAELEDDEEEDEAEETNTDPKLPDIDLQKTNDFLASVVKRLKALAKKHGDGLRQELSAKESDERVIEELLEEHLDNILREDEEFHQIADALMEEVEERFELVDVGTLQKTKQGWPVCWTWSSADRATFIRQVLRFSSNYAPLFGSLLTPLVNGIRVAGPFTPSWSDGKQPKLVLYDGEGLGHSPDSSAALSTTLMRRIKEVDAVALVDNAAQPMQAAPMAAMRAIVTSGNASKLLLAFTHFDDVKGDNLPKLRDKERHVLASCENALTSLGEELGPFAERSIRGRLAVGCFYLGGIDEGLDGSKKPGRHTIEQLKSLLIAIDQVIEKPAPVKMRPVYDKVNLVLAVKQAAERFHNSWLARLGILAKSGIAKEHWTRVKALTRRLANLSQDEYDTLKPVADLETYLRNQIYISIQNPTGWKHGIPTDEEKQQVYADFASKLGPRIMALSSRRIWQEHMGSWQDAFNKSGTGSTFVRAKIIAENIYETAAPIPDVSPSPDRNKFLHEVLDTVAETAKEASVELE